VVEDEPPPDGLLNPTNYVERMVGDKVSLLQTRQRHEALKERSATTPATSARLGYQRVDRGAARRTAGARCGVDGKWGPNTEDAIQRALAEKGCTADECAIDLGGEGGSSDPLAAVGRLGWIVIGGVAIAGVAAGVVLVMRGRA
jgi:hypothetical protein